MLSLIDRNDSTWPTLSLCRRSENGASRCLLRDLVSRDRSRQESAAGLCPVRLERHGFARSQRSVALGLNLVEADEIFGAVLGADKAEASVIAVGHDIAIDPLASHSRQVCRDACLVPKARVSIV